MNLIQLKYFEAVCKYGTVMRAAEQMHISQPSLSAAIKSLEDEFGVTLFRRGHHGMTLTAEGETLYKMGTDLLKRAGEVEDIMKELGGESKILRLGVPPMIGSLILPRLFRDFHENNPDIRLDITEGSRHELYVKLTEALPTWYFCRTAVRLTRKFPRLPQAGSKSYAVFPRIIPYRKNQAYVRYN